jgi:DNA mismatch endonuclease (patch repair protein)
MADVHSAAGRSRNMAAIRAKDTKPELTLRRALFAQGFRYRLHERKLPGRPDLVLAKYRAAIFVHGCFFHGHECATFRWPMTNASFWRNKIEQNRRRDKEQFTELTKRGWRVLVVWECALRGTRATRPDITPSRVAAWLRSEQPYSEIVGT